MTSPFAVADEPRPVPVDAQTPLPPVTLAWRALRSLHEERREEHLQREQDSRQLQEFVCAVAEELHRLRRLGAANAGVLPIAARLEEALARLHVEVPDAEGLPYTGSMLEYVENAAQRPVAGLAEPQIAEVILPVVLQRGQLLRMGKAVIAVPG